MNENSIVNVDPKLFSSSDNANKEASEIVGNFIKDSNLSLKRLATPELAKIDMVTLSEKQERQIAIAFNSENVINETNGNLYKLGMIKNNYDNIDGGGAELKAFAELLGYDGKISKSALDSRYGDFILMELDHDNGNVVNWWPIELKVGNNNMGSINSTCANNFKGDFILCVNATNKDYKAVKRENVATALKDRFGGAKSWMGEKRSGGVIGTGYGGISEAYSMARIKYCVILVKSVKYGWQIWATSTKSMQDAIEYYSRDWLRRVNTEHHLQLIDVKVIRNINLFNEDY